jgi:hypothetical protein
MKEKSNKKYYKLKLREFNVTDCTKRNILEETKINIIKATIENIEFQKGDKIFKTISTTDNSIDDSIISLRNESKDFPFVNKYFMSLKPIKTINISVNNHWLHSDFPSCNKKQGNNYNSNINSSLKDVSINTNEICNYSLSLNNTSCQTNLISDSNCHNNNTKYNYKNSLEAIEIESLNNQILYENKNISIENKILNYDINYPAAKVSKKEVEIITNKSKSNVSNHCNIFYNDNLKKYNNKDLQYEFKSQNFKQIYSNLPEMIFKKHLIDLEVFKDFYENLIVEESYFYPCFGYMLHQIDINEKMRAVLIDWLSEVHLKFKFIPETLFSTVNLIDRFLSKKIISKNKLQLVGVGSLIIACKYEEIYCPNLNDFVFITDKAYTKEEIVLMEKEILETLDFKIANPSINKFYDLISINFGFSESEYFLGRYFLELFLLDYRINKYFHSVITCAVVYLVMKINKYPNYKLVNAFTFCSEKDIKSCAKEICFLVENIDSTNLLSVKNKYATKEFHEVSKNNIK